MYDVKTVLSHSTLVLNTVAVTAVYVGADGRTEATLLHVTGLSCLSDLKSLSESGLYMALHAHAPLGDDWEWSRELNRSEKAKRRHLQPQYGSRPR